MGIADWERNNICNEMKTRRDERIESGKLARKIPSNQEANA